MFVYATCNTVSRLFVNRLTALRPVSRFIGIGGPGRARVNALRKIALVAVISVTLCGIHSVNAKAQDRVALLLASESYSDFKASKVTVEQVQRLGGALENRGFDVTVVADPSNAAARAAFREFSRKAMSARFALVVLGGHVATYRRQSFFLPVNTKIRRPTDLLSRGISISNVANMAGQANAGAVFFLTTIPDISSAMPGISAVPELPANPGDNVIVVFSNSTKVPVSRVNEVSSQAADELTKVSQSPPLSLSRLVNAASAGGIGLVIGGLDDGVLAPKPAVPKPDGAATAAKIKAAEERARKEAEAREAAERKAARISREKAEAERKAHSAATKRLREAEARAKQAEARAKAAEAKAREAAAAKEAARRQAAKTEAKAAAITRQSTPDNSTKSAAAGDDDLRSLQVVEALLGRSQRRAIQAQLRAMGLYSGPIDGLFGPKTRDAIKGFQGRNALPQTGYLTPKQFQKLVETAR